MTLAEDAGIRAGGPAGGSRRRSVLAGQHEQWNLSRDVGLVFGELRDLRDQLRPQLRTVRVVQLLRQCRERLGTHLDLDPGDGLDVVLPVGWVGADPAPRWSCRESNRQRSLSSALLLDTNAASIGAPPTRNDSDNDGVGSRRDPNTRFVASCRPPCHQQRRRGPVHETGHRGSARGRHWDGHGRNHRPSLWAGARSAVGRSAPRRHCGRVDRPAKLRVGQEPRVRSDDDSVARRLCPPGRGVGPATTRSHRRYAARQPLAGLIPDQADRLDGRVSEERDAGL